MVNFKSFRSRAFERLKHQLTNVSIDFARTELHKAIATSTVDLSFENFPDRLNPTKI